MGIIKSIKNKWDKYAQDVRSKALDGKKKKEEIEKQWNMLFQSISDKGFIISKKINVFLNKYILIDKENKKWVFLTDLNSEYTINDNSIISNYFIKKNYVVGGNIERIGDITLKIILINGDVIETFIRPSINKNGKYLNIYQMIEEIKEWLEPIVNNNNYIKQEIKTLVDTYVYDEKSKLNIIINGIIGYEIIDSNISAESDVTKATIGSAVAGPTGISAGLSDNKKYDIMLHYDDRTKNVILNYSDYQVLLEYVADNKIPKM